MAPCFVISLVFSTATAHRDLLLPISIQITIPNAANPIAKTSFHFWIVPQIQNLFQNQKIVL